MLRTECSPSCFETTDLPNIFDIPSSSSWVSFLDSGMPQDQHHIWSHLVLPCTRDQMAYDPSTIDRYSSVLDPAFVSVATIIGSQVNAQSIPSLVQDLHKIFETRRASPDDRLPNGQTLLHVRVPQHSADRLIDQSCKVLMWPTWSANLDYQREPAAALSIFAPGHL
jgi:hypothetical protein